MLKEKTDRRIQFEKSLLENLMPFHLSLARVANHLSTRDDHAIMAPLDAELFHRLISEVPPEHGRPVDEIYAAMDAMFSQIVDGSHHGAMAYWPNPGLDVAAAPLIYALTRNVFTGTQFEAAGPTAAIVNCLSWLRNAFGFPQAYGAGGCFTEGGTSANWIAMRTARQFHQRRLMVLPEYRNVSPHELLSKMTMFCSETTHHSVERGIIDLGFQPNQLRVIKTDSDYRLNPSVLHSALWQDMRGALLPSIIVINIGTTSTGAIDPIDAVLSIREDVLKETGHYIWVHADAAIGGPSVLLPSMQSRLAGLAQVDSITIDPHKWLFQPFNLGAVLVRDDRELYQTFRHEADYLDEENNRPPEEINLQDYGPYQTRGFHPLTLWFTLRFYGVSAFRDAIAYCIELAEYAQEQIESNYPSLELVSPAQLSILTFRYVPSSVISYTEESEEKLNAINEAIMQRMWHTELGDEPPMVFINSTRLKGKRVLRLATANYRTTRADIDIALKCVTAIGDRLMLEGKF